MVGGPLSLRFTEVRAQCWMLQGGQFADFQDSLCLRCPMLAMLPCSSCASNQPVKLILQLMTTALGGVLAESVLR